MNEYYLYEYSNLLERILSYGIYTKVTEDHLEKMIARSSFFQSIEKSNEGSSPITNDISLIKGLFPNSKINMVDVPTYTMSLWASESYIRIQNHTKLSFEAIFLYMPLEDMYRYFHIYHEMDFSQIIDLFLEKQKEKSILEILCERFGYKTKDVARITQIPYDTVQSLKLRRRNFLKTNVEIAYKLASLFKVRIETIAEIQIA